MLYVGKKKKKMFTVVSFTPVKVQKQQRNGYLHYSKSSPWGIFQELKITSSQFTENTI